MEKLECSSCSACGFSQDKVDKIFSVIYSLPKRYYSIFVQYHLEKKDMRYLAKEYGVSEERIRGILIKSRKCLRDIGIDYDYEMISGILNKNIDRLPFIATKTVYVLDKEAMKNSTHEWHCNFKGFFPAVIPKEIEDLFMSVRVTNALNHYGINTLQELLECTEEDLLEIKNFGRKCIYEVESRLKFFGLKLKTSSKE